MAEKIFFHTEKRKISDLVPHDHNPRTMTKKQVSDLRKSLEKFNLAEIPVINRDNTILAGHQRLRVLAELKGKDYTIEVRVPNRQLSEKEAREYLIRSNKNTGEWDFDELANSFDMGDLTEWGFSEKDFNFDLGDVIDKEESEEKKTQQTTCPQCGLKFEPKKTIMR